MGYSIYKMNFDTHEQTVLYDCIEDFQKADLLAQLAMCNKRVEELIFIAPGWNRSIDRNSELYNRALQLAEEYKYERR